MPFKLEPLRKEDAQEAARLAIIANQYNFFQHLCFPNGQGQATLDSLEKARRADIDDNDSFPMKVVDIATGALAACAVWVYTKAMTNENWDQDLEEALKKYPEANHDILDPYLIKEQEAKRKIMGNGKRWFRT